MNSSGVFVVMKEVMDGKYWGIEKATLNRVLTLTWSQGADKCLDLVSDQIEVWRFQKVKNPTEVATIILSLTDEVNALAELQSPIEKVGDQDEMATEQICEEDFLPYDMSIRAEFLKLPQIKILCSLKENIELLSASWNDAKMLRQLLKNIQTYLESFVAVYENFEEEYENYEDGWVGDAGFVWVFHLAVKDWITAMEAWLDDLNNNIYWEGEFWEECLEEFREVIDECTSILPFLGLYKSRIQDETLEFWWSKWSECADLKLTDDMVKRIEWVISMLNKHIALCRRSD